jgi:hypothetical protein
VDLRGTSCLKLNVVTDGALAGLFATKEQARAALAHTLAIGGDVTYYLNAPEATVEGINTINAAVQDQMISVQCVMGTKAQRSTLHSTLHTAKTIVDFGEYVC